MSDKRMFHISDVLSITTGRLFSHGILDILDFMTGQNNLTHMIPRVSEFCRPYLFEQIPGIEADSQNVPEDWKSWLKQMEEKYGEVSVQSLNESPEINVMDGLPLEKTITVLIS